MKITIDISVLSDNALNTMLVDTQQLMLRIFKKACETGDFSDKPTNEIAELGNFAATIAAAIDARCAIAHFENYDIDELRPVL